VKSSHPIKLIKLFLSPLLYAAIGIGVVALLISIFRPDDPMTISTMLAVLTIGYIVWFLAEGRKKLKEL